jgi:hypothetical protein
MTDAELTIRTAIDRYLHDIRSGAREASDVGGWRETSLQLGHQARTGILSDVLTNSIAAALREKGLV